MNEAGFRKWLEANYAPNTVATKLSEARQLRAAYGDLDALYEEDRIDGVFETLRYSAADKARGRPNPSKLNLRSDLNRDLSGYRTTVNYYRRYREGDLADAEQRPDSEAVHKAIDECASMGVEAFLDTYGFGSNITYWVLRDGERYPSKAIFGVAHQYMPGGTARNGENCNGTEARKYLARLGFEIVEGEAAGGKTNAGRPFILFDSAGAAFKPVRHGERDGRSVYKIKPPGASNKADEAIAAETIAEVARAMLVDGLPARVQSVNGGPVNYIGYGKQKLVRYELDAGIAREIGVPPNGSVDQAIPLRPSSSTDQQEDREVPNPINLILYGPPGTGKTWRTAAEAVRLCDGDAPADRDALMARYRELEAQKRIAFVTFHQNFDYETFVEGLRPETGESEGASAGFRLEPRAGIFREICALADQARTRAAPSAGATGYDFSGRRFWKMGQGAIGTEDDVYESALANNYIALGWGGAIDWSAERFSTFEAIKAEWLAQNPDDTTPSNWTQAWPFRCEMKVGDIVIVPYGNTAFRAVAEVTGDYRFEPAAEGYYAHRRDVRWILKLDEPLPLDTIVDGNFTMRTLYSLPSKRVNLPALARLIAGESETESDGDAMAQSEGARDQFVLIIDEINRANISKVFGELITLLEPDKRLGMPNALTLALPYSKKRDFGVPANLHIVGTMNTADRSIAQLDTALRRRFVFRELAPDPDVLPAEIDGVPIRQVLRSMNDRIEYLVDREHRIGHAFFVGCSSRRGPGGIDAVMRDKVIPLLQEYFFEDWSRVAAVLGEPAGRGGGFLDCRTLEDPTGKGGDPVPSWRVRAEFAEDAYHRIIGKAAAPIPDEVAE